MIMTEPDPAIVAQINGEQPFCVNVRDCCLERADLATQEILAALRQYGAVRLVTLPGSAIETKLVSRFAVRARETAAGQWEIR